MLFSPIPYREGGHNYDGIQFYYIYIYIYIPFKVDLAQSISYLLRIGRSGVLIPVGERFYAPALGPIQPTLDTGSLPGVKWLGRYVIPILI